MKQIISCFLAFVIGCAWTLEAVGQVTFCDGQRAAVDLFSEIDSVKGLQYGASQNSRGSQAPLFLDLYHPVDDGVSLRPGLILAFGGGFTEGKREDMAELCRRFAQKGFVAVTIDYRLLEALDFLAITDSAKALDFVVRAAQDVKASIRYMRSLTDGENTYRIDPDKIFVGGVSAGAIAANHAVYLDSTDEVSEAFRESIEKNGGWAGNSNDLTQYSIEVAGVVSWSGALNNASWIDPTDPPLISVHEDGDEVVPFGSDKLLVGVNVFVTFQGSQLMDRKAQEAGIYRESIVFEDRNSHVSYFLDGDIEEEDSVINHSAAFMKTLSCAENTAVSRSSNLNNSDFSLFPNPSTGELFLNFDTQGDIVQIHIFSLEGKLHRRMAIQTSERVALLLGDLSPGLYSLVPSNSILGKSYRPQLLEIR